MAHIGIGFSRGGDARAVAAEAASMARAQLGSTSPTFALVFATEGYSGPDVVAGVRDAIGAVSVGGSTAPGIFHDNQVTHDGIGVMLLGGDAITGGVGAGEGLTKDAAGVVDRAVSTALEAALDRDLAATQFAVLLAPDAICGNGVAVARAAAEVVGSGYAIFGGGSGDDLHFQTCWQFAGDHAVRDGISAATLIGRGGVGVALRHGCRPYGPPATVTRSTGSLIQQIEWDEPYRQYVAMAASQGDVVDDFLTFAMLHPFGIPEGDADYVLRSPVGLGAAGAIQCCSDVPSDGVVRVMAASRDSLLSATTDAAAAALRQIGGKQPDVAIMTACVSRDFVLGGPGPSAEIAAARLALGDHVPIFGALLFGEIGRQPRGRMQFHSKAVQICAVRAEA